MFQFLIQQHLSFLLILKCRLFIYRFEFLLILCLVLLRNWIDGLDFEGIFESYLILGVDIVLEDGLDVSKGEDRF